MKSINDIYNAEDLVFDVGANAGIKTEEFLSHGASVVCFEPQPNYAAYLKNKFLSSPVIVIGKGVSDKPGKMVLSICSEFSGISTFSEQWKTGRFAKYKWDTMIEVETVTLDQAIEAYGTPKYCKIDVEGFEYSVLSGLTKPIPALSFEYAREFMENTEKCIRYCDSLGMKSFNFTIAEDREFHLTEWVNAEAIITEMKRHFDNNDLWGDVYCKI